MRRFTKVFSAMFAVIMLFTGLPQASGVEEQTADPKIPLSSSGELLDIGMSEDETMTEPSEHIYDLSLSKSRIYLLPGMSFRLTVSAVTEPFDPQPELSTESTAPTEETTAAPALETTAPVTDEAVTEETTLPAETELNDDPVMPQLSEIEITESEATETTVKEATADAPTEETTAEETIIEETTTEPTTAEETTADIVTEPETTEAEKPIEAITPIPIGEDDNESYIWRSNDESVATVSSSGVVTAVSLGMAVVTASTVDGSCTAVCEVMVVNELPNGNENSNSVMATNYATPHTAITIDWVNQYTSPESETAARTISPGTMLKLIRKEGNFYVAHTLDSTTNYYMWAANIFDRHAGNGYIEICKVNTSDTRRHWDMYTTQSLRLAVRTGGTATWSSSNANIATISGNGTITPLAAGTTYITATQNGKKDVIHLTVITKYDSVKTGVVKESWCSKYRCTHSKCTVYGRKEGDTKPYIVIRIYGESAGFYYANVVGENSYIYMWKSNIALENWYQHCTLNNLDSDGNMEYKPQGLAMDSRYCYSFQIGRYNANIHQLYRYDMNTGAKLLMTPVRNAQGQLPGTLLHANDAAIAYFTENGKNVPYLFVAALDSGATSYIVKLGFNESGEYWEAARYTVNQESIPIAGITLLSGGGAGPAFFLINFKERFTLIRIAADTSTGTTLNGVDAFTISTSSIESDEKIPYVNQGIHYDSETDRLYLAFSNSENSKINKVIAYKAVDNTFSDPIKAGSMTIIRNYGNRSFELEALAFRPNSTDKRLWFSTFEGDFVAAGIYTDPKEIRYMEGDIS